MERSIPYNHRIEEWWKSRYVMLQQYLMNNFRQKYILFTKISPTTDVYNKNFLKSFFIENVELLFLYNLLR